MVATMKGDRRWSPEVVMVAAGIVNARGIPQRDAFDIARRRVERWGGRVRARFADEAATAEPVDLAPGGPRPGYRVMLLSLGDARAWVWARRC